ncbi:Hypothetical protein SRAE_X000238500 [Strongyloides ratti]|uniref:Uncharacterized protein n=1 Tax=Strongyloides ratti TaxID=34506 RepID=A0A090KTC2_STRRB|nr:Hypothetical protein SRAE_X000238500 [Strongyloides ratti]CEF60651.1 Hypothetical protein SRAE_X000238500 [Strongyloides ratti]
MVNSSSNQGEFKQSENLPTVPFPVENKQLKSNQINTSEFGYNMAMESESFVNSISEISRNQRAGWLRQGNKIIRFASVRPFDETFSTNTTPSNSLESDEGRAYEYPERLEDSGQNYNSSNNTNYYQNGPIYQQPFSDNRLPIPPIQPPPHFVNGFSRPQFNNVTNVPVIQQTTFSQPQILPGHLNYPPFPSFPPFPPFPPFPSLQYIMPQVGNTTFPTFVGYSCYPTTIIDHTVTRRIFNPPSNPIITINSNTNHSHQQSQSFSQGYQQNSGIPLHSQQNVERTIISTNINSNNNNNNGTIYNNIQEHNSSNINNLSLNENDNIQREDEVVSSGDTQIDVDDNEEIIVSNISPSINVSQENVPNHRDI